MDTSTIEGKFESVSMHLGIGDAARQQARQQLQALQHDVGQLKARLEHAERQVRDLKMQNQGLRRVLGWQDDIGAQEMDLEHGEVNGGIVQQPHGTQQQDVTAQEQATGTCNRCGNDILDGSTLNETRHRQPDLDSRMPVCTFCWAMSRDCDTGAQCQTCISEGRRCKRKLCDGAEYCRRPGCPRLHPSQWDDTDDWDVDEGRMPEMGIKPEDPEDHYP